MTLLAVGLGLFGRPNQTYRLANGTEISFISLTRGPNNLCFPGGAWDRLRYRFGFTNAVGFGWLKLGAVRPLEDVWRYADGAVAHPDKGVVWLRLRGGTNGPVLPAAGGRAFFDLRATLSDGQTGEWEMRPNRIAIRLLATAQPEAVTAWDFSSYPRRGRDLEFKLYGRDRTGGWEVLARFTAANPYPSAYPAWVAHAPPVAKTNGELVVSLIELTSGVEPIRALKLEPRPFTRARFIVLENGKPTEAWRPDWKVVATDATGNEGDFAIIDGGATNGAVYLEMQGTSLNPSEAWRLKLRFARECEGDPRRVWTSPALPVRYGSLLPATVITNFLGGALRVDGLPHDTIRIKLTPMPSQTRLQLIAIEDDRGRRLEGAGGSFHDDGFDAQWTIPPGARAIRLTLGLAETRDFEFLARPKGETTAGPALGNAPDGRSPVAPGR